MNFPDKYSFAENEKKWQKKWQETGIYHWRDDKPRDETFVIDTPPPTVSGILHMGHIFSYTQADFIARYKRMRGFDVFYPMGFDDNGLPTERLVEKERKIRATDLPREEFIKICQEVVVDAEKEFEKLFNSIALSVDWRQKYETISDESRKISQLSFLDLFEKGEVERKYQPMFWDPVDQTAIAQAEIVDKELESYENYIYFGVDGSDEKIEIMTTRPEMLPACVAVMVHPDNFAKYEGKFAITPLFGAKVPFVADDKVDKEKGTGFVMCCTFGDETDIKWWREHKLDTKIVLNKYGKLDLPDYPELNGKKANKETRDLVFRLLEEKGFVAGERKKITHVVKTAERSGAPLEIIPTHQWFVKVVDKKDALLAKINECKWYPEYMKVRAEQWTESLSWDWCISRQRYFGVPFPVWYVQNLDSTNPKILTAEINQLPVNPIVTLPKGYRKLTEDEANKAELSIDPTGVHILCENEATKELVFVTPDFDVMDTWATSSVSPQLSSKGINREASLRGGEADAAIQTGLLRSARNDGDNPFVLDANRHAKLFPADMRPQAHEIIRTWAFYTITKAMLHENSIPWKTLMISGWCLAEDKSKMSKSKGNVITPVPLIETKSSDVVRYWASTSNLGADTAYSEDVLKIGNKLVNKLWNATKFASINLPKLKEGAKITEVMDKWILSRLNKTIKNTTEQFEEYEYSKARMAIEDFFWNDFCDNYLEIVKARSYGETGTSEQQQSALAAIRICIDILLRLWAPFVPHITEELHHIIYGGESIHTRGSWPEANLAEDEEAEKLGAEALAVIDAVRKAKSEKGVSVKFPVKRLEAPASLKAIEFDLASVTSAQSIVWSDSGATSVELADEAAA